MKMEFFKKHISGIWAHSILILVSLLSIFPFIWLISTSLKGNAETTIEDLNQQLHTLQEKLVQYLSLVNNTDTKIYESIWNKIYSPINPREISVEKCFQLKEYIDWCDSTMTGSN